MVVNRTQALVLGFFLVVMASLVVIRAAAPEVYDQALGCCACRWPSCNSPESFWPMAADDWAE